MRQIRDMSIIEIDVTNACHKACSNCTRFCGHHNKTYFMDFETFKQAVDSLDNYSGQLSIIGGEPLLHPQINDFLEYLQKARDKKRIKDIPQNTRGKAIAKDYFAFARVKRWFELAYNKGKCYTLFTSIPNNYYKAYENLAETISNLWLNDHSKPSFHQPILVSYKDLGIEQAEFEKLRDNCWLQNCWSASITPKGTFFCEIAGTMDALFNGPGGHPIEPGWWNKDLSEWKDQFHWCDLCGMPLKTFSRNANDGIDDATKTLYDKLSEIDSPKFKNSKVNLISETNLKTESISEDMYDKKGMYLASDKERLIGSVERIKPSGIIISNFENMQNSVKNAKLREWILTANALNAELENFIETIKDYFLNPGYLFKHKNFLLFNPLALSLQNADFEKIKKANDISNLYGKKICVLEEDFEKLPDYNILQLKELVLKDYSEDADFKKLLAQIKNSSILLLNVASPFHTYGIAKLLKENGNSIHILLSKKFMEFFEDGEFGLTAFDDDFYDYIKLKDVIKKLKTLNFDGFILPYAFTASSIKPIDNYADSLKTAYGIAGKSLGIINIKREFIEPDYDIWEES